MSQTGDSSESSPASRGRRSRPPHAQEDSAEAAGERLRQLNIGEGDDREHNRMIRSQYRELISNVQRKEPAWGAPGLRDGGSGLAAGEAPGMAAGPGRVGNSGSVPGNSGFIGESRCFL